MASGSFNISTSNQYVSGRVDWSSVVDIPNNRSTVTATFYLSRTNTGFTTMGNGTYYMSINGNQTSNSQHFTIEYNSNTVMVTHTVVVNHNTDGTKTITISVWGSIPSVLTMSTQSGNAVLDTIPRSSIINSFPNFEIGSDFTVAITRYSTSFTHELRLYAGSTLIVTYTGVATSKLVQLTSGQQDAIYATIPNATSRTMTLRCYTYSGSTLIGNYVIATATATVPASIVPTFDAVTHSENVAAVTSAGIGNYVKTLSKLNLALTGAAGAKSSTITSYRITFDGATYSAQSATTGFIQGSGTLYLTGRVTDSRGRVSITKSINITVLDYAPPNVTEFTLFRSNSGGVADPLGTYVRAVRKGAVASLNAKNKFSAVLYSRVRGTTSWTTLVTTTNADGVISMNLASTLSGYAIDTAYDFRLDFSDKFNTSMVLGIVSTGEVAMSWSKAGIGVGKIWQQGALDVGGDAYVDGSINVEEDINLTGKLNGSDIYKALLASTNLDTIIDDGIYEIAYAISGIHSSHPSTAVTGGTLIVKQDTSSVITQTIIRGGKIHNRTSIWVGYLFWNNWVEMANMPTSITTTSTNSNSGTNHSHAISGFEKIIEEGSNSDGSYLKLDNGVMIVFGEIRGADGANSFNNDTRPLPASFGSANAGRTASFSLSGISVVNTGTITRTNTRSFSAWRIYGNSTTAFGVYFAQAETVPSGQQMLAAFIAIGRWK